MDLEPKTKALLVGDRLTRAVTYLSRLFQKSAIPHLGADKVTGLPQGLLCRVTFHSLDPAAIPNAGREGESLSHDPGALLSPPGHDGPVRVLIPDTNVSIPARRGRPAEQVTPAQMLERAKQLLAETPMPMLGSVKEIRFNPTDNAQDIVWQQGNPNFTESAMTGAMPPSTSIPRGCVRARRRARIPCFFKSPGTRWDTTGPRRRSATLREWHLAKSGRGGRTQNLPSQYAGNNLGEDLAETVRLFICSNEGRDAAYDIGSGREISGSLLRRRYGNRFRALEAHFDTHPSEMLALKMEFGYIGEGGRCGRRSRCRSGGPKRAAQAVRSGKRGPRFAGPRCQHPGHRRGSK